MKYIVDANVLSEPTRPSPDSRALNWLRSNEPLLAVDPVVLGELRYGILLLPKGRKRKALENWFEQGIKRLVCLNWDAKTAHTWAELLARLKRTGKAMPIKDSLIAASGIRHGLTIATRNTADFKSAGVRVVNPFAG